MIIGRGLLGNALKDLDGSQYLFYVNGISNSVLENIPRNNFEIKEIEEIAKMERDKVFIYFSTSQVNSKMNRERAYVKHKLYLEKFIADTFAGYSIIRTTNLVGNNPWNTHTLFNYLHHAITVDQPITVNPSLIRNFLDATHFAKLVKAYLEQRKKNEIIEIVNPVSYKMQQIINEFEIYFLKKFILQNEIAQNDFAVFELNTELSIELFNKCKISSQDYISDLLKKYYAIAPVTKNY